MPPESFATFPVMNPGPRTARNRSSRIRQRLPMPEASDRVSRDHQPRNQFTQFGSPQGDDPESGDEGNSSWQRIMGDSYSFLTDHNRLHPPARTPRRYLR